MSVPAPLAHHPAELTFHSPFGFLYVSLKIHLSALELTIPHEASRPGLPSLFVAFTRATDDICVLVDDALRRPFSADGALDAREDVGGKRSAGMAASLLGDHGMCVVLFRGPLLPARSSRLFVDGCVSGI